MRHFVHLVDETDRFDSADLIREDVENPQDVILLGFLVDPRTGLGGDFRSQFKSLVERLRTRNVTDVLKDMDIRSTINTFNREGKAFREFLLAHSQVHGKVVVTDYRDVENVPAGNRFLIYTTFPDCNVSLRIQWGLGQALGKNFYSEEQAFSQTFLSKKSTP